MVCIGRHLLLFLFVLRKTGANSAAIFFLFSGLLTSMLMLDDLFLLHERIFPEYLHWRQRYIYLSYVSSVLVYLAAFRHIIFKNNFLLLALALFFLSVGGGGLHGRKNG